MPFWAHLISFALKSHFEIAYVVSVTRFRSESVSIIQNRQPVNSFETPCRVILGTILLFCVLKKINISYVATLGLVLNNRNVDQPKNVVLDLQNMDQAKVQAAHQYQCVSRENQANVSRLAQHIVTGLICQL